MGAGISVNYIDQVPLFKTSCWKVSRAKHKTTLEEVSLWEIDYDIIQSIGTKADQERFLTETLSSIYSVRRIFHPGVLKILELSDSIKALNFAAEPIETCLEYDSYLSTNDIIYISYQLCKTLDFLHSSAHIIMFGLSISDICLTKSMDTKICLFTFSNRFIHENGESLPRMGDWKSVTYFQPPINYISPEYYNNSQCTFKTDVFSYGCIIGTLIKGSNVLEEPTPKCIEESVRTPNLYQNIPKILRDMVIACLNVNSEKRPSFNFILHSPLFDNVYIKSLRYFEVILTKTQEDKYNFYCGISKTLNEFSIRILQNKFLEFFIQEIKNEILYSNILIPIIFEIGKTFDKRDFYELIVLPLYPMFTIVKPYEINLIFLRYFSVIVENISEERIYEICYPIIETSIKSEQEQLQKESAQEFQILVNKLTGQKIEEEIVPSLVEYLSTSTNNNIINCSISLLKECLPKVNHNKFTEEIIPRISASWNRQNSIELSEIITEILQNLQPTITLRMKYIVPIASEIVSNKICSPKTQIELCNIIKTSIEMYRNRSRTSETQSAQWLSKTIQRNPKRNLATNRNSNNNVNVNNSQNENTNQQNSQTLSNSNLFSGMSIMNKR